MTLNKLLSKLNANGQRPKFTLPKGILQERLMKQKTVTIPRLFYDFLITRRTKLMKDCIQNFEHLLDPARKNVTGKLPSKTEKQSTKF